MRRIAGRDVKTFSIGFEEEKYSEIKYVDIAARHFGLKSYKHIVSPQDLLDAVKVLVKEYDEPFGNSSAIAAYYCMKLARDNGVNVLLGGDGGDENFAGYERYVTDKLYSVYQSFPRFFRRSVIEPIVSNKLFKGMPFVRKAKNYIEHSNMPSPERLFFYELYAMRNNKDIFSEDFLASIDPGEPLKIINAYYQSPDTKERLNRLTYLDSKAGLIDNDLRNKIDKISQIFGVAVRFPMLDLKLWELGAGIPARLKLKAFTKKYIYKKAFDAFLPKEIIMKRKHGFGVPYALWLKTEPAIRRFTEERLLDGRVAKRGYFRKGFFERMLRLNDSDESAYYGDILWPFLMLEIWHNEWIDK